MSPTTTESPPPRIIDPKFRDRRIAVLREQGRRRLRMLLATVAIATAAGCAYLATESPLLNVNRITVIGAGHTPAQVVAASTRVRRGAPLVWTNRRVVARRVEALPWVASARVSISLPGELRVRIVERVAAAYLSRADGKFAEVDGGARILAIESGRPPNLPEIVGAGPPTEPGRTLDAARPGLVVIAALGRDIVGRTAAIDVTSGAVVHLTGTGEVRLGAVDQMTAKVAALKAVLANLAGRQVGYIDVRVPDAPVVGG